ncbi:hypothetical protein HanOQP8_Chr17g0680631 [Helianthus annuus]|nr:hypothetical protein HanHA89_Chr17g0727661 [Helianthus annuus]KAJ0634213.1 hypothetical protein HanLR1_Chr17g0685621 [Helianthus annuus]KAJ0638024.1 hypothetical protein HanOQP8_Chr17g0680631 [Helianthus annuus]
MGITDTCGYTRYLTGIGSGIGHNFITGCGYEITNTRSEPDPLSSLTCVTLVYYAMLDRV